MSLRYGNGQNEERATYLISSNDLRPSLLLIYDRTFETFITEEAKLMQ